MDTDYQAALRAQAVRLRIAIHNIANFANPRPRQPTPLLREGDLVAQAIAKMLDQSPVSQQRLSHEFLRDRDWYASIKPEAISAAERGELASKDFDGIDEIQGIFGVPSPIWTVTWRLPSDKADGLEGASDNDSGIRGRLSKPPSLDGGLASFDAPIPNTDHSGSSSVTERPFPYPRSDSQKLHHAPSQEDSLKCPLSPPTKPFGNTSLSEAASVCNGSLRNDDHTSLVVDLSRSDTVYNQESLYNSAVRGSTAAFDTSESPKGPFNDTNIAIQDPASGDLGAATRDGSIDYSYGQPTSASPEQLTSLKFAPESPVIQHTTPVGQEFYRKLEATGSRQGEYSPSTGEHLDNSYGRLTSASLGNRHEPKNPAKQRTTPKDLELISLTESSESSDIEPSSANRYLHQHQDLPSSATRYALDALAHSVEYPTTLPRQFASNHGYPGQDSQYPSSEVQLQQSNAPDAQQPTQIQASPQTVQPGNVRRAMMAGLAMQPNPWYHQGGWARRPEHLPHYSDGTPRIIPHRNPPPERPARRTFDHEVLNGPPYPRRVKPAHLIGIQDEISRLRFAPISKQLIYDENLHPALRSHPYFNPKDFLNTEEKYVYTPEDPDRKYPELCRDNVVVQNLLSAKIREMTVTPDVIPMPPAPKQGVLKLMLKEGVKRLMTK